MSGIGQIITTTDPRMMMLILGGRLAVEAGLVMARNRLHLARVELAALRRDRHTMPDWMRGQYPLRRRWLLLSIARWRVEIVKCQAQMQILNDLAKPAGESGGLSPFQK